MWPWLSSLNALLFSYMSVLSPASTWSCLLCSLTLLPALSSLLIPGSFLFCGSGFCFLISEDFSGTSSALPVAQRPFLAPQPHDLPPGPPAHTPPTPGLQQRLFHTPESESRIPLPVEGIPPYGGRGSKKVKEEMGEVGLWDKEGKEGCRIKTPRITHFLLPF